MKKSGQIHIGISGWTYPPWRKDFYPEGLPQTRELAYASQAVSSIEVNGTFYSLQKPESFRKWRDETPDNFIFAVKANRYITHIRRLKDVERPLANFLASGLLELGPKLGPILWQFPPSFRFDPPTIEAFLKLLPRDTREASVIARGHDEKVTGQASLKTDHKRPMHHAMEVRHKSFETAEFVAMLRNYRVALVVADTAGKWPFMEDITSDFIYVRLHGAQELYASGYTDNVLEDWRRKVHRWAEGGSPRGSQTVAAAAPIRKGGRDVFVYFDNDVKTHAPRDARTLMDKLGIGRKLPEISHCLGHGARPNPQPARSARSGKD